MNQPTDRVVDPAVGETVRAGVPDGQHRWRCGGCGNMTRFDVVREARTQEFWHLDLSGAVTVEDTDVVTERIVSIACRWCGRDDTVEVVARPGADLGGR